MTWTLSFPFIPTLFDRCRIRHAKEQGLVFSYSQVDFMWERTDDGIARAHPLNQNAKILIHTTLKLVTRVGASHGLNLD
jgi:hypothetical protein